MKVETTMKKLGIKAHSPDMVLTQLAERVLEQRQSIERLQARVKALEGSPPRRSWIDRLVTKEAG